MGRPSRPTKLHQAASKGDAPLLTSLLARRADLAAAATIEPSDEEWRQELLGGIDYGTQVVDIVGVTPLHVAVASGHERIVRLLIQARADVAKAITLPGWAEQSVGASRWIVRSPETSVRPVKATGAYETHSCRNEPMITTIHPREGILQMAGDNEAIRNLLREPEAVYEQKKLFQVVGKESNLAWNILVLNMAGETVCEFFAPVIDTTLGDLRTSVAEQAGLLLESFCLLAGELSLDGKDNELLSLYQAYLGAP